MVYYSVWDKQTECYMETGRNSQTKQEALNAIAEFCLDGEDFSPQELAMLEKDPQQVANLFEFEIHSHEEPLGGLDI